MSAALRAADEERLRKISRVNMHLWHLSPTDEPESLFLLRLLAARVAALREARAEIERLQPVIAAARDLWRVGAPLRDKLPALAAALDALDAAAAPDEWQQLVGLLRRHVNSKHFDQFDRWRMKDRMGNTVYIHLAYKPTAPEEVHGDLDASPPPAGASATQPQPREEPNA